MQEHNLDLARVEHALENLSHGNARTHESRLPQSLVMAVQHYLVYVRERLENVDYYVAVSDVQTASDLVRHVSLMGAASSIIQDDLNADVERFAAKLEDIRTAQQAKMAQGILKPAFEAGFELACIGREDQVLRKAMPDGGGYWILTTPGGVHDFLIHNASPLYVIATSDGDGPTRTASVAEALSLNEAVKVHSHLTLSEESEKVIYESWAQIRVTREEQLANNQVSDILTQRITAQKSAASSDQEQSVEDLVTPRMK